MDEKKIQEVEKDLQKWKRLLSDWRGRGSYSPGFGVKITDTYIDQSYEEREIIEWLNELGEQRFYEVQKPFSLTKTLAGYSFYREKFVKVKVIDFLRTKGLIKNFVPRWRSESSSTRLDCRKAFETFSWIDKLGLPKDHCESVAKLEEIKNKERKNDKN